MHFKAKYHQFGLVRDNISALVILSLNLIVIKDFFFYM